MVNRTLGGTNGYRIGILMIRLNFPFSYGVEPGPCKVAARISMLSVVRG